MGIPTLITVTGTVRDVDGPISGRLVFASTTLVRDETTGDVMVPDEIVAVVGADGLLSVEVPATDDPGFSPTGWTWEVRPHFAGWKTPFSVSIPYDAILGTLDLGELTPLPPDGTGDLYATINHTHEGGGGGEVTYSTTVVTETAYGQASTAGNAATVSRGNHTHGTPALPTPGDIGAATSAHTHTGVYDPAGSASAVGTAAANALNTHEADSTNIHGIANTANLIIEGDARLTNARTPTAHASSHADGGTDEISVDGSQVTSGTVPIARIPTGTSGTTVSLGNHTHVAANVTDLTESVQDIVGAMVVAGSNVTATYNDGANTLTIAASGGGGSTMVVKRGIVTSGAITPQVAGAFAALTGGPSIVIPAVAGDYVAIELIGAMWQPSASSTSYLDLAVSVGGTLVRFCSSGTGTPCTEGEPSLYAAPGTYRTAGTVFEFVAQAGDISGGNVTVVLATKGGGTGSLYATTAYPFKWRAINYGAATVS